MIRHFTLDLAVLPFVIAPIAQIGSEAAFLLGPLKLTSSGESLRILLNDFSDETEMLSPFLAQVGRFQGRILAAVTIKTMIPDARSGRLGQNLILGVWIRPTVLLFQKSVFARSYLMLDDLIQGCVGKSLSEGGSEEMIRLLQDPRLNLDQRFSELTRVLGKYESEFCTTYKEESPLSQRIKLALFMRRILRKKRARPAQRLEDAANYWRYLDCRFDSALGDLDGLLQESMNGDVNV